MNLTAKNKTSIIYDRWESIPIVPHSEHDKIFIDILSSHGFSNISIVIPLKKRYTKGRQWNHEEINSLISAWHAKKSLTFIAACLNRNPQDMIYKLLEHCKRNNISFTEKERSEGTSNWNAKTKNCALELFANGLPCWKIAVIFKIDFEHIEKELTIKRNLYGHDKKNPFQIYSIHKQFVNQSVISNIHNIKRVLEAFAGEGRFTEILLKKDSIEHITAIENNKDVILNFQKNIHSNRVHLIQEDNRNILGTPTLGKFDLIDLDPFVTCHEQLEKIWPHLNEHGYLFLTFGGEYRRCFIKTNRKSIFLRYGFYNDSIDNKQYLEDIPYYFMGHVAKTAFSHGFTFNIIRAVRYANYCRFWLSVSKDATSSNSEWLLQNTHQDNHGLFFTNLKIPKFKDIRKEMDTFHTQERTLTYKEIQ